MQYINFWKNPGKNQLNMNIQRKNGRHNHALLSFGCWNDFGDSFQLVVVSNEIQIHSPTDNISFSITLKSKMEIIRSDGVFKEIKMNDHIYKACHKDI